MERTDWLDQGYGPAEARFLVLTAITHHRFGSPIWGKDEVRKLQLELTEIDIHLQLTEIDMPTRRLQCQLTEPGDSGWSQCRQLPL